MKPYLYKVKETHCSRERQLERAVGYHYRGWQSYRRNDLDSALCAWRKAICIRYHILGDGHPSTEESMDLIDTVLRRRGLHETWARKKYLRKMKKSINHEANGDKFAFEQGKYRLALKEYQKALDLEQETIGRDHPVVAALYRKMAFTLKGLGELERSTLVYCDALA